MLLISSQRGGQRWTTKNKGAWEHASTKLSAVEDGKISGSEQSKAVHPSLAGVNPQAKKQNLNNGVIYYRYVRQATNARTQGANKVKASGIDTYS